ncbi:choloylglycine hydrolase [Faecalicoccus pleomorphus]|uniref:choloylglycine hydrolase n=1 Tax=Faecalicoccus pleomorphus TaxID=1323 RepID=A0A7X9NIY8_9FIRM|nr:choloylglycine hydrolase [Faecalicoccus pleomorphus]NME45121.1 choloylglycine hydrolase family protein [Faecalicoccus pleomorphus]
MCTSFTYVNQDFYFGRNLDLDCGFGEEVVITPRHYPFTFHHKETITNHYAMIGMATVIDNTPLYAEAVNEKGLGMAGLQFSQNAVYFPYKEDQDNIASFEIIPWILSQCETVHQAWQLLEHVNILDIAFKKSVPNSPLHWIIANKEQAIVVESVQEGLKVYENPIGVLTNNPPFDFHRLNLTQYLNLTKSYPENRFDKSIDLKPYAVGMGALGLPGDASSVSRFVKTAFLKHNLYSDGTESDNVQQYFRVLQQVAMVKGTVMTDKDTMDHTLYSCCINATKGIYYYATYENAAIQKINMHDQDLNDTKLVQFALNRQPEIF